MPEENKNLEIQKEKKPGKSWLFRIGAGIILLAIGLAVLAISTCKQECYIIFFLIPIIFFPLGVIGIFLIGVHYFLKIRKKKVRMGFLRKMLLIFSFFVLIWVALKTTPLYFLWESWIEKIAIATKNEFLCEMVPDSFLYGDKIRCYSDVAKEKRDIAPCDRARGYDRIICYIEVAGITKDESICEKLADPQLPILSVEEQRDVCYGDVAEAKKDPSLCKKITNFNARSYCENRAR